LRDDYQKTLHFSYLQTLASLKYGNWHLSLRNDCGTWFSTLFYNPEMVAWFELLLFSEEYTLMLGQIFEAFLLLLQSVYLNIPRAIEYLKIISISSFCLNTHLQVVNFISI
jgi:hypothetical protein